MGSIRPQAFLCINLLIIVQVANIGGFSTQEVNVESYLSKKNL